MNFKGWQKLKEDAKTCTLQHPSGHVMTIAVKALPKLHQEALSRLKFAEGGEIDGISQQGRDVRHAHKLKKRPGREEEGKEAMDYAKDEAKGRASFERESVKPKLQGLADGGEVKKDFWSSEHGKQALAAQNKEVENIRQRGKNVDEGKRNEVAENPHLEKIAPKHRKNYDGGGDVQADSNDNQAQSDQSQPPSGNHTPITINVGAPASPQVPAPVAAPAAQMKKPVNPAAQYMQTPVNVEAPVVPDGRSNTNPNGTMNPSAVMENSQQAIRSGQDIEAAKAKALDQSNAGYGQGSAQNIQMLNDRYADLEKHTNDAAEAIQKGLINPKHYQESMSSGQKTATALGLFLGGMGVPFGGHNFAQDFLDKQIDRDIKAQETRSDQQKTILGAYQHLYGEGTAAYNATKATLIDARTQQADQIALKLGTPMAAQKAMELKASAAIEKSKLLKDAAVDLANLPGNRPNQMGQARLPGRMNPNMQQQGSPTPRMTNNGPEEMPIGKNGKPIAAQSQQEKPVKYMLLAPDAEQRLDGLRYTPKASDEIDQIKQQYTSAQQAEKVLNGPDGDGVGGIHDLMQQMYSNIGEGKSFGTHTRRVAEKGIGGLPYIGGAAEQLTELYPKGEAYKQFQGNETAMKTDIANALKGILAPTEVNDIVEKNLPAYGDSKESIARKEQAIVNMIKKAVSTSLLSDWHLTYKKK